MISIKQYTFNTKIILNFTLAALYSKNINNFLSLGLVYIHIIYTVLAQGHLTLSVLFDSPLGFQII